MRPPYYRFYYRDHDTVSPPHQTASAKFVLVTCLIVFAGLVAVAFLSGL